MLVRLPGPAAVSHTRQNPDTPTRLVFHPASESVSWAIRPRLLRSIQAATCRSRLRAASVIDLRKCHSAASIITANAAHPSCPSERNQQRPSVRVVGFPQAHRPSVPRTSMPMTHGPSVSHRAAVSFAPSESVPHGSQAVVTPYTGARALPWSGAPPDGHFGPVRPASWPAGP